jgi:uncharacterized protein (TIGR02246 family)
MTTRGASAAMRDSRSLVAILIVMLAVPLKISLAHANAAEDSRRAGDDAAVREVVAGFSDGWNRHDARVMCASVAEDVRWVGWRGDVSESRKEVEDNHAALFADLYKNTHRTDIVKSIRYLGPELASVDDFWTMTGARTREGADWPYRAGYANFLMAKRGGRWIVIVSHTADFNAKVPAAK